LDSLGKSDKAGRCLETASRYRNGSGIGYRPYLGTAVYPDPEVNAFFFPSDPHKAWDSLDMDWFEGTLGMVTAFIKHGRLEQSSSLLARLDAFYRKERINGLPYSTYALPFQFNTYPSLASTSWYLIATRMMEDETVRGQFFGK
jgi:hypothetical protein